jgi:hypothetical protein
MMTHDLKLKKTSQKITHYPKTNQQSFSKKLAIVSKIAQLGVRLSSRTIYCFWGYFFSIKPMKIS